MNEPIEPVTPAERLDLARCLLLSIWQAYSAQGHNCGRSATAATLEAAMGLLGAPRTAARRDCEFADMRDLIKRAQAIHSIDLERESAAFFNGGVLSPEAGEAWAEKLRAEIESGFAHRMA